MYSKDDLKASTLTELREIAEKIKLDGYERLKKEYLIEEIVNKLEEKKELDVKNDIHLYFQIKDYRFLGSHIHHLILQVYLQ